MNAKYNMTVEQNIFVAKRNIVDYIWKSAKLEGIAVTYPDTETIYNGLSISNVKVDDIIAINNLKHAWRFILDNIAHPTDYALICKINQFVGGDSLIHNAGFIRNLPVTIGGTSWTPDMPIESQIKEELADVQKINSPTDRAVTLMLYCMRKQVFLDGNKRTAMLAANHTMIANGAGIISVPLEAQRNFTAMLINFYETNDMGDIKKFIYDKCIDGISFQNSKSDVKQMPQKKPPRMTM